MSLRPRYTTDQLEAKWQPILEHKDLPPIKDKWKRAVIAQLLDNQHEDQVNEANGFGMVSEAAPANASGAFPAATNLKGYDPVMISLIRRALPNLIAFDVLGVQPMTGPTGLIFAMKAKYATQDGTEALFNEADTRASADPDAAGAGYTATAPLPQADADAYKAFPGLSTADGEAMGTSGADAIPEMAFSIDRVPVSAKTRLLKAEYTIELAQDLKAIHGLDAEAELANILAQEINSEINREVIRTIYNNAKLGAEHNTATAGTFDMDVDANGRWLVEKFKGLHYQLEREANAIAQQTRRGRGNIIIAGGDVVSALSLAGLLDSSGLVDNLSHDGIVNSTFVGVLNGRFKVYVDPYVPVSATNYAVVGYKGENQYDAGIFYCPYVPLQMVRGQDPGSFQPKIGYRTRYGMVSNPFANSAGDGSLTWNANVYYRKFRILNLI